MTHVEVGIGVGLGQSRPAAAWGHPSPVACAGAFVMVGGCRG